MYFPDIKLDTPLKQLKLKREKLIDLTIWTSEEDVEQSELPYTAGGSVNLYKHSKSWLVVPTKAQHALFPRTSNFNLGYISKRGKH